MIQTLSSKSPSEWRSQWPEIGILSQQEIFSNPQSIRDAFDATEHSAVIVECPSINFDESNKPAYFLRFKHFRRTDLFVDDFGAFSFKPFAFAEENAEIRVQKIVDAIIGGNIWPPFKSLPTIIETIAADLVTLNYAWGADNIDIVRATDTAGIHRDDWEAFALRTIVPPDKTVVVCKEGDPDIRDSFEKRSEEFRSHGEDKFTRPPPDGLLLLKGNDWGKNWEMLEPPPELHHVDILKYCREEERLKKLYHLGVAHISPQDINRFDRFAIKYGINYDRQARSRMQKMPRRALNVSINS